MGHGIPDASIGNTMANCTQPTVRSKRKAYKRTTVPNDKTHVLSDTLDRVLAPENHRPGESLVGDITSLSTRHGWLFLATVIELATRTMIGQQTAEHMGASLAVDALAMARQPTTQQASHWDRA